MHFQIGFFEGNPNLKSIGQRQTHINTRMHVCGRILTFSDFQVFEFLLFSISGGLLRTTRFGSAGDVTSSCRLGVDMGFGLQKYSSPTTDSMIQIMATIICGIGALQATRVLLLIM